MTFRRNAFLFILLLIFVAPFYIVNFFWIVSSAKTMGESSFVGKEYTGQLSHSYTVVSFELNGEIYTFNTSDNIFIDPGTKVEIRYNKSNPGDAKLNSISALWAPTFFYSVMPLVIILIIIFHPSLIPYRSRIRISRSSPFIYVLAANGEI